MRLSSTSTGFRDVERDLRRHSPQAEDTPSDDLLSLFTLSSDDLSSLFDSSSSNVTSSDSSSTIFGPGAVSGRFIKSIGVVILDAAADVVISRRLRAIRSMLESWDRFKNPPELHIKKSTPPLSKFCGSEDDLSKIRDAIKVLRELSNPVYYSLRLTNEARRTLEDLYAWLALEIPRQDNNPEAANHLLQAYKARLRVGFITFSVADLEHILRRWTAVLKITRNKSANSISPQPFKWAFADWHGILLRTIIGKFCFYDPCGYLMHVEFKRLLNHRVQDKDKLPDIMEMLYPSEEVRTKMAEKLHNVAVMLGESNLPLPVLFPGMEPRDYLRLFCDHFCRGSTGELHPIILYTINLSIILNTLDWLTHANWEWVTMPARAKEDPVSRRLVLLAFHSVRDNCALARDKLSSHYMKRSKAGDIDRHQLLRHIQSIIDQCAFHASESYERLVETSVLADRDGEEDVDWDWVPPHLQVDSDTLDMKDVPVG